MQGESEEFLNNDRNPFCTCPLYLEPTGNLCTEIQRFQNKTSGRSIETFRGELCFKAILGVMSHSYISQF